MKRRVIKLTCLAFCLIPGVSSVAEGNAQAKHLAVAFSHKVPAFERFSVDSLGTGKLSENPLLPVTNLLADVSFDGTSYSVNGKASWAVAASGKTVTLRSDFAAGVTVPPFTLTFDQKKNHATLLGRMKPGERKMALPCVLHLPGMGTVRITCNSDGAALDYDARRFVRPSFVSIAFPPATAGSTGVEYRLEVVAIHPDLPGIAENPLYDGFRRDWLNIFQVNPRLQMLANNASSDACAFTLFEYSDLALHTPPLAEGLTCNDLIRMTLDRYLAGTLGYGQVGYGSQQTDADLAPWGTPWTSLDTLPSLLISACNYTGGTDDLAWARANYGKLVAWGREMFAADKDGNGLIEYPGTGNFGDRSTKTRRPANWWDCINFGHEDAFSNALAYRAGIRLADLALRLGQKEDAAYFSEKAERLRAAYAPVLLNPATGVVAGWKSADGQLHDYWFTFVQGMAITFGLLDDATANRVMDRVLAKMQEVGYTHFALGLPGNLIPVRRGAYIHENHPPELTGEPRLEDGSDGFQYYENGGATGCWGYYTVKALFKLGRPEDARMILHPMLGAYARGQFHGFDENGRSVDWRDWKGRGNGYEGLLVDNFHALLAVLDDVADPLRAGFADPPPDFRALPLHGKRYRGTPAENVSALSQGRWGGWHNNVNGAPYLRAEEGWSKFRETLNRLREKGLTAWIYDEAGYPSGRAGGLTLDGHPGLAAQGLFYTSRVVRAASPGAHSVRWQLPEGEPFYVAAFPLDDHLRATAAAPLDLTAQATNGWLTAALPAEPHNWRLAAFVQNRLHDGTHAPITGGKPYINVLDPEAARRFIEVTYEAYYRACGEHFGKTVRAIFNDEVSLMSGYLGKEDAVYPSPAVAWYHGLPEIFKARTGYDIRACLPVLFENDLPETVRKRSDFYALLGQQVADAFFKPVSAWCAAHGIPSTGHLLWEESLIFHANFYGSAFPSLRAIDWPGIDVLGCGYGHTAGAHAEGGPVTPKLASSVARLYGKGRVMSESFCFVKRPTTVDELIAHYAWQAVLGVNALTTITVQDVYEDTELARFNEAVGRINFLLTQGCPVTEVAVLYPIASVWAGFKPTARHVRYLNDNPAAKAVDDAWREATVEALACPRDLDYVDEEVIQQSGLQKAQLVFGENRYRVLVLPGVTALSLKTLKQIRLLLEAGGKVVAYKSDLRHCTDPNAGAAFLATLEQVKKSPGFIQVTEAKAFRQALLGAAPAAVVVEPETMDVYCQQRCLKDGELFFLVNNHPTRDVSGAFTFRASGSAELWDPVTGKIETLDVTRREDGRSSTRLMLGARQNRFIRFYATKERQKP